ncbi:alanine--tRNA ligase [Candidatus Woesearchaeota archaeon]|nr:alanine--tRNA ligase [Candidatus Woesearchaeota archaeon]
MQAAALKKKYLEFFRSKQHAAIPSASLIPEHDPTVLFTTAGMHPLVPYLMGQPHPRGKRLASVQKCIRTGDIDAVGDAFHLTFFEMLGNWSLGDYFKKEAIQWSYEFLTGKPWLGMDKNRLFITCFKGDKDAPKDAESAKLWEAAGIPKSHIFFLPKEDNWWGPAGETGPCGPDTEMFYDTGREKCGKGCKPGCGCSKYFEIWNDVFMQYEKTKDGSYLSLTQKNVDTGMGVERTAAVLQGKPSVYEIETFQPIIAAIRKQEKKANERSTRIIADHVRAAAFILGDQRHVSPSNIDQGYVLRRLIRRAIRHGLLLGIEHEFLSQLADMVVDMHGEDYPELRNNKEFIRAELIKEDQRFRQTLLKGLQKFSSFAGNLSGADAFLLFQSYGFPMEMTVELAQEKGMSVDTAGFQEEFQKHQQLSRQGAEKRFKGGLADASAETIKLHTATHLLNEALRKVIGKSIVQKGSNITADRLRFDFNLDRKLTAEELRKVEELVNKKIKEALPVRREEMTFKEALAKGAQAEFQAKYEEQVSVYSIGDFSREICGGPHVQNTSELGTFKIIKEEGVAAGVRRIKAVVK